MRRKAKERTKRKNQRKRKLEEYRQKELNSLSVPVFSSVVSNLNSNQQRSSWNLSEGHSLAEDSIRELKDDFQLVSETNDRMNSKRNSFKFKNHFESIESNDSGEINLFLTKINFVDFLSDKLLKNWIIYNTFFYMQNAIFIFNHIKETEENWKLVWKVG